MMTKIATDKSEVVILTSDNPKTEHPCICSRLFLSAYFLFDVLKSGSTMLEHVLVLRPSRTWLLTFGFAFFFPHSISGHLG